MEKDFLDELMEELQKLKEKKREISIPVPAAPHELIKTVVKVAKQHDITSDELQALMSMREVTPVELNLIRDLEESEK